MIEDKALLGEYLSETEQLLDSLLTDLNSLGSQSDSDSDINLVNRIFRAVHSLKGLSGMMGLAEVKSLAHSFEDLLDEMRLGRLPLDRRAKAMLREAGEGLGALIESAARQSASREDFDRLRELIALMASRPRARKKMNLALPESLRLSESERALLTRFERSRIIENINAGKSLYSVKAQFEVEKLDAEYHSFTSLLGDKGELIATLPGAAQEASLVAFKLIWATDLKEASARRIAKPYGARISRLQRSIRRPLKSKGRRPKGSNEAEVGPPAGHSLSPLLPSVSPQELMRPLSPSVRVELSQIDELSGLAHELSIESQRFSSMADRLLNEAGLGARERFDLKFSARRIKREFLELEERLVELRMVSLGQTFTRAARLAERLASDLGKSLSVEVSGRETQLDKIIVDRISDPIYHVLRNAIDHGLESPAERRRAGKPARGKVKIEASLEGARVVIAISDDGQGLDAEEIRKRAIEIGAIGSDEELSDEETLRLIFQPGFSTAEQVSAVSGRGVGLDAVERTVHELGGEILVFSEKGRGARFELVVPTTLVMISAFIVRVSDWRYAINVGQIIELLYLGLHEILGRDGRRSINWRGSPLPLIELRYLLALGGARVLGKQDKAGAGSIPPRARLREMAMARDSFRVPVLVMRAADRYVAVAVEQFEEQREIIVKSLGSLARKIKGVVGAVDLEGGDVALVLDLPSLLLLRSVRI